MGSLWTDVTRVREAQMIPHVVNTLLQRKCDCGQHTMAGGECEECAEKRLQRQAAGQTKSDEVPSVVHNVLRSSGQPLDAETLAFMEPRFNHDFSRVRLHTSGQAAESARAVNALAYTSGWNVVFGQGQYNPHTQQGRHLLAHELTHVVQQRGHAGHQRMELGLSGDIYERQADDVARAIVQAPPLRESNSAGILTQPHSSVARFYQDFGGILRRQHDTTATDPQDTTGAAKRGQESQCPDKFKCTPPYKDRQVCCSLVPGVTGTHLRWLCYRENPKFKGEFIPTQHSTYDEAQRVCSKKDKP